MNLLVLSALALGVLGNESSKPERLDPEQNQKARLATFHWRWILSGEQMAPENAQALVFAGFGLVNRDLIVKEEAGEAHFVVTPPFTRPEEQGPSASTMESKLFGSVEAELPLKAQKDYSLNWYPVPSPQLSSQFPEPDARSPTKGPSETSAPGVPQHVLPFQNRLIFLGVTRSGNLVLQSEKDPRKLFELDLWATVEHGVKQRPFPKPRSEAIRVERAGGYIYLRLGSTMDGYKLSEPKVQNLTQYSLTAHLFESPPPDPPLPPAVESPNLQEPPAQTTAGVARATATSPPPRPQTVLPPPETEVAGSTVVYSQFSHRKPPQAPLTDATSVKAAESSGTVPANSEDPNTDVHDVGVPSAPADRPTPRPADLGTAGDSVTAEAGTQSSPPGTLDDSVAAKDDTQSSLPGTLDDSAKTDATEQHPVSGTHDSVGAHTGTVASGEGRSKKRIRGKKKNKKVADDDQTGLQLAEPTASTTLLRLPYWATQLRLTPFPEFDLPEVLSDGSEKHSLSVAVQTLRQGDEGSVGIPSLSHLDVQAPVLARGHSEAGPSEPPSQVTWRFLLRKKRKGKKTSLTASKKFVEELSAGEKLHLLRNIEERLEVCAREKLKKETLRKVSESGDGPDAEIERRLRILQGTEELPDYCADTELLLLTKLNSLLQTFDHVVENRALWWGKGLSPWNLPGLGVYPDRLVTEWPPSGKPPKRVTNLGVAAFRRETSAEIGPPTLDPDTPYQVRAKEVSNTFSSEAWTPGDPSGKQFLRLVYWTLVATQNYFVYGFIPRKKALVRKSFLSTPTNREESLERVGEAVSLFRELHQDTGVGPNYVGWRILEFIKLHREQYPEEGYQV